MVLGRHETGLALTAQLLDTVGLPTGGPVTAGFFEIGGGTYSWYGTIPYLEWRGTVRFTGGVVPVAAPVNPDSCAPSLNTVAVDHNYGGTDAWRVLRVSGQPVDGAEITAFTAADWDANRRNIIFAVATSVTLADGRWAAPMLLTPGLYVLLIGKSGVIIGRSFRLTVA